MIFKSFSLLQNNIKNLQRVNSALPNIKQKYRNIMTSEILVSKQNYLFSSFFQSLNNDEKLQYEARKPKPQSFDQNSRPKSESKKSDLPLSAELKMLAKQLEQEQSYFTTPLYHTKTYHYASFLLKAVRLLHQRKAFSDENMLKIYFREVKNSIKSAQNILFTPNSALRLIEEFVIIDFDGDESFALQKIVSYVEHNFMEFSQNQLEEFQTIYKEIMVNKAFGPVKFRHFKIQKSYKSEHQRKLKLIKQKITQKLKICSQELQKGSTFSQSYSKKSFIIKIPSENFCILTYPKFYEFLSEDQIYEYLFEMKQLISSLIGKSSKTKHPNPLKIRLIQSCQELSQNNLEIIVQKGIVYRKKKEIIDEMQKIKNMRKLSLKQQIERVNEKKKALKEKQKLKEKEKEANLLKLQKDITEQTKIFDFISTLKHNIEEYNQEFVTKMNKKNTQKLKLTRKARKQLEKNSKKSDDRQENQHQEDDEEELEEEDQQQVDQDQVQQKRQVSNSDSLKLKSEFIKKMQEEIEKQKKMKEKQQEKQSQKIKSQEHVMISELITIEQIQHTVSNQIKRISQLHTVDQLQQFKAYSGLIESLHKVIVQIQKDELLQRNFNLKKTALERKNKPKSQIVERFYEVKNVLNESLDTGVIIDYEFEEIFGQMSKSNFQNRSKSKVEINESPKFYILPEKLLLDSLNNISQQERKSSKNKRPKNSHQKDEQSFGEKQKILEKIFQNEKAP